MYVPTPWSKNHAGLLFWYTQMLDLHFPKSMPASWNMQTVQQTDGQTDHWWWTDSYTLLRRRTLQILENCSFLRNLFSYASINYKYVYTQKNMESKANKISVKCNNLEDFNLKKIKHFKCFMRGKIIKIFFVVEISMRSVPICQSHRQRIF